jgi:hypothetical protein
MLINHCAKSHHVTAAEAAVLQKLQAQCTVCGALGVEIYHLIIVVDTV